ncbi:hypothetical protein [Halalkalibacterium ligniniphilum]|uniref:hypothetical protein n=1 Tax=Halalkalibacterium ligniniphilum TaxID=1134413 RepID=UPI000344A172|nr:hypothetical protein [Halalkalibacterium ligniniphilum]
MIQGLTKMTSTAEWFQAHKQKAALLIRHGSSIHHVFPPSLRQTQFPQCFLAEPSQADDSN